MQQSLQRDNKQEIISYIAGLMDGEGHISIGRNKLGIGYRYRYQVYFSNTDTRLINFYIKFLEDNHISFYVRKRSKPKSSYLDQYEVSITNMKHAKAFLEMVSPYITGNKKEYAEIVLAFINSRLDGKSRYTAVRNNLGRFTTGYSQDYLDTELDLYNQYKKLRDPQRLHAMPRPSYFKKRVKI